MVTREQREAARYSQPPSGSSAPAGGGCDPQGGCARSQQKLCCASKPSLEALRVPPPCPFPPRQLVREQDGMCSSRRDSNDGGQWWKKSFVADKQAGVFRQSVVRSRQTSPAVPQTHGKRPAIMSRCCRVSFFQLELYYAASERGGRLGKWKIVALAHKL